jgi:hypothetical protein
MKEGWKEEKREKRKKGEIAGFRECRFSFLHMPWWNRIVPLPWLCRVICKTSQNKGL